MKDQLNITINTVYGSRQFSLSKRLKILFLSVPALVVLFVFGMAYQSASLSTEKNVLSDKIENLEKDIEYKQAKVHKNKAELESLQSLNTKLEKQSSSKINHLKKTLHTLEDLAGIKQDKPSDIEARLQRLSTMVLSRQLLLDTLPNGSPVKRNHGISSAYGTRLHPIHKRRIFHEGLDYRGRSGDPIVATADGIVIAAKDQGRRGLGRMIEIQHSHGFTTRYGHLRKILVKDGAWIKKGQVIGHMGSTGISTGTHLHYEVLYAKKHVNPRPFVSWNLENYEKIFTKIKDVPWESLKTASQQQVQKVQQRLLLKDVALTDN